MMDLAERTTAKYETIERIIEVGEDPDGLFFRVQGDGLQDMRDRTWHAAAELYADIPESVSEFLKTCKGKKWITSKIKHKLKIK